ncbi:MAG: insulinase family protein [Pseudomonadales bacterium]|nr:insulinase family protein [Pseudomonadales bacterium]
MTHTETFQKLRSHHIEALNITVEEFIHPKTGAKHIHIDADNNENVFLVALRTVPHDSTGVAHILEHTALCGSRKYPVRDPFFMMIRRSLNTFMNAMTSSDWTAYPFASQNRKDFNNLLDVYLDAVFFSRLDPLDFAQEGHRVEFEKPDDPSTPLVFKGVVFNEMKGAMSSIPSTLWHTLGKYLFPTTTYHYNSGGDPECIPDLSYEELKFFYNTHYHPSNAVFMTYGDIPAHEHQQKFEKEVLSHFDRLPEEISVPDEKRYLAPIRVEEAYAFDEDGSTDNKTHILLGWLLGKSTDLEESLKAQLLSAVLLENSASPLQHLLETTSLGSSPSPLCGLDDSQKELLFIAGIEGSDSKHTLDFEKAVLATLQKLADEGVEQKRLEACLHQLELQQREVGGGSYPYGLQLIMTALTSATHRGDPIALLDLDPVLEKLRQEIKKADFIKTLVTELLIENPHRVTLTMHPEKALSERRREAEKQRLAKMKAALDDDRKQAIITQAQALKERQKAEDDEGLLPKVGLEDIPVDISFPVQHDTRISHYPLATYHAGTNGLVYQQLVIDLPELSANELTLLPLYAGFLTELGIGNQDYMSIQNRQSEVCGSLSASPSLRSSLDNLQAVKGHLVFSSKALQRNHAAMSQLLQDTFNNVRFDELKRLKELVSQSRARREMSITGNGHALAMTAAAHLFSPLAQLNHQWSGLAGIQAIKSLDNALADGQALKQFALTLQAIHQKILTAPRQFLLIGEEDKVAGYQSDLASLWSSAPSLTETAFCLDTVNGHCQQLWQTNTQVNFCSRAFPTVPSSHPDAPALVVLGGFLRNGYLHTAIREQGGAYGGGAGQDNNTGAFRFFSYRDPRLEETLADFDSSVHWLLDNTHKPRQLEEAILGVISSIDKPSSPAGEARQTFHNNLHGRTPEVLRDYRSRVLKVSLDDLKRVGERYLLNGTASTAVITRPGSETVAEKLKLDVISL